MAQYRNVSGQDRYLALPDWPNARLVEADTVIDVEDAIAKKYDFDQSGIWESMKSTKKKGS